MAAESTSARPRNYTPRPRTKSLRHGKACMQCRHLKIRCDGNKPACGSCVRMNRPKCEYRHASTKIEDLEETQIRLEERLLELEGPSSPVFLTDPSMTPSSSAMSAYSSDDEPYSMIELLVDKVLCHGFFIGFFMDAKRFRDSALLSLPFGDPNRPSPALLSAVYLLGAYLSRLETHESGLLEKSLHHAMTEISSRSNSSRTLDVIQAQVLLANYFFMRNRFVEAEYHCNGAVSVSLSCNLHTTLSSRFYSLPNAETGISIQEGERINGFWAVFCTDRLIQLALNKTANHLGWLASPIVEIDTPFPLAMSSYPSATLIPSASVIESFFLFPAVNMGSSLELYVKAILLLHRMVYLTRSSPSDTSSQATYSNSCKTLAHIIDIFNNTLTNIHLDSDPLAGHLISFTRALSACARMKIHALIDSSSKAILIESAIAVLQATFEPVFNDNFNPPFLVTILCRLTCETLVREVLLTSDEHFKSVLIRTISDLVDRLTTLAADNEYIEYHLVQIQHMRSNG